MTLSDRRPAGAVQEPVAGRPAGARRSNRVSLAFDDKVILRDVSFTLLRGHTKIILGASGSGKSTILKLILGLLKPDGGRDLGERRARRHHDGGRADEGAGRPRDGVPGRRALRFADRSGEHRLQALRGDALARGQGAGARRGGAGLRRPERVRRPHAVGAVGRAAAARGDRAGHGRATRASCSTTRRPPASIRLRRRRSTRRWSSCATSRR